MKDVVVGKINGETLEINRRKAENTRARTFRFLEGIGLFPSIMKILAQVGYDQDTHKQGWSLLHRTSGYDAMPESSVSISHQNAIANLDQWDEMAFRRTKGALRYRFKSQNAYIFRDGLKAEQGRDAVQAVQTYLARIDALRQGTDPTRDAHRQMDKDAVALLEKRKILAADVEKQVRQWLKDVESAPTVNVSSQDEEKAKRDLQQALVELVVWFDEWSDIARQVVTRRDYKISLGLAERRTRKKESSDTETEDVPSDAV